jgi:glycosyltransferase involved in cell wall biosynthesis
VRVLLDVSAVPDRPVGAGVYTIELARRLATLDDLDLVLLARSDDGPRWRELAPAAELRALVPDRRPTRLAWEQTAGPRVAARLGVDLWHGPHYTLPLRARLPMVTTVHDLTFFDHPEWHRRAHGLFFRRMIPAAVHRAAVCVCVSQVTATRLAAVIPHRGADIVARHGVDHEHFRAEGDEAADRAALAAHGITPPYVAFTGTIEPRKDVPTLVRAFAEITPDHPELRLVVAGGDGWGADHLRVAVATSGVASRILRTGYLAHALLPALLRRAAAVAYPSLEEGFGFPALEALACGAPLVTTTGSAVEELVGDAALLVAPRSPGALAEALRRAMSPDHTAWARTAGPARAAGFTWDASVATHVAAYRRALDSAGAPA